MSAEELDAELAGELDAAAAEPSAWARRMQRRKNRAGAKQGQPETQKTETPLEPMAESGPEAIPVQPPLSSSHQETNDSAAGHKKSDDSGQHASGWVIGNQGGRRIKSGDDSGPHVSGTLRDGQDELKDSYEKAMNEDKLEDTDVESLDKEPQKGYDDEDDDEDEAASKMSALRKALQALRERRVELDAALSDLDAAQSENEAHLEQLEEVRAELESERAGKQRAIDDLAAERERAAKAEKRAAQQAAAAKAAAASELAEANSKASSLQEEVQSLRKQLGAVKEEVAAKAKNGGARDEESTKALRLELDALRTELEHHKAKRDQLAAGGKEMRAHVADLLHGNQFLQQKLDEAKASRDESIASLKANQAESDLARKQKASSLDEVRVHKTQLAVARKELEEARSSHKTYSTAAGSKLEELRRLKASFIEARAEFESGGGSWAASAGLERLRVALDSAGVRAGADGGSAASTSSPFDVTEKPRSLKRPAATTPLGQTDEEATDVEGYVDAGGEMPVRDAAEALAPESAGTLVTAATAERPHKIRRRREKGDKTSSKRDGETTRKKRKEGEENGEKKERTQKRIELKERKDRKEPE